MNKGLILKTFIRARYFHKFKSRKRLEKYQQKQIKKQLVFLEHHSPYFQKFSGKTFEELPYMNKKVMMDNFDRINTAGISKDDALKLAINSEKSRDFSEKLNGYSVGLSSGTSGHRGVFVLSDIEIATWVGGMMAKMLPKGKIFGTKVAFFLRADNNLYESSNSKMLKFEFFDILKPMEQNIIKLQEFQPTILIAPPSVLLILAEATKAKKLSINPVRIISVAEVLTEKDEQYLKRVFKQKIIYQVYQCTEGFLGYTCEHGSLHLNEDVIAVEKEYLDDTRFTPVITDFVRTTQPIVKYRLNDILVEDRRPCKCGTSMTRLKKIEGRMDDVFEFDGVNDRTIKVFPDFISRVVLYVPKIKNYRVVQESSKKVIFYLDNIDIENQRLIKEELKTLAKRMRFKMPATTFKKYESDFSKKMKRVERIKK
ncbi:CoF synthetase [Candidatus Saccharibacteria bacterium]|nr:CoF synthetase [Candidatus Saccharibacteria bacterium]